MTKRKIPERPHWKAIALGLAAHLESIGCQVDIGKYTASVLPMPQPCAKQPRRSLARRCFDRINWLFGS